MNLARIALTVLAAVFTAAGVLAQELDCKVEVNTDQLSDTREEIFTELQQTVSDYMNHTRFTDTKFAVNERIGCRLFLTVTGYNDGVVSGELQVQSVRPVFNSSYNSTLLNIKDEHIAFPFRPADRLTFSETTVESNLTALLDFYAYLILALDFDSFSPRGGQPYVERMASIVQQAQASGSSGWRMFDDNRNRAAIAEALSAAAPAALRDMSYEYHRNGLDVMSLSPDKGRDAITSSLATLSKVNEMAPFSVALTMFHDSKLDELINVYSRGAESERKRAYEILENIYPAENARLSAILHPSNPE